MKENISDVNLADNFALRASLFSNKSLSKHLPCKNIKLSVFLNDFFFKKKKHFVMEVCRQNFIPAISSACSALTMWTPPWRPLVNFPRPLPPARIWLFTTNWTKRNQRQMFTCQLMNIQVQKCSRLQTLQLTWRKKY